MLNLLRYRAYARYEDGFDAAPCSGREAFHERYRPAFRRLAAGKPLVRMFSGPVLASLVGPQGERWDEAAINEYGDFAAFRSIVDTETYRREVAPHRHAALEDSGCSRSPRRCERIEAAASAFALTKLDTKQRAGELTVPPIARIGCCGPRDLNLFIGISRRSWIARKWRYLADYQTAARPVRLPADKKTGLPK